MPGGQDLSRTNASWVAGNEQPLPDLASEIRARAGLLRRRRLCQLRNLTPADPVARDLLLACGEAAIRSGAVRRCGGVLAICPLCGPDVPRAVDARGSDTRSGRVTTSLFP